MDEKELTDYPPNRLTTLLGVDAGGSHTSVVLADSRGTVLARVDGPASAMRPGGAQKSTAVIADTVRRAAAQAGCPLPAAWMGVGAAGAGRDVEQGELEDALTTAGLAEQVRVVSDGEAALRSAFGTAPGMLISAGTGSIAYARDPAGRLHRAGGYGWQMGDEGGGYWLGRRALAAAGAQRDGRGEGSTLGARLLGALGLRDFDDLVRWAATATPAQVAGLAPHVVNAARDGERVAQGIINDGAMALGDLVRALLPRFPADSGPVSLATGGGLLRTDSPLLIALRANLSGAPVALAHRPVDPALGALSLAPAR
ncbi:MAG TPA: BadF/BadG/BcrA/BcrD ATPase family protein [Gemmatimonadales bacterium]|nr:BadF/BadG/BcrA/BcrD ATPase family protein [Gemmatimonadales bacterium]